MITLHILRLLQENNLGTIDQDLFWESKPLDKNGVTIISRGGPLKRAQNLATQAFDLYSRGADNLHGADKLEKIWEYMVANPDPCDLPTVPNKSNKIYKSARLIPTGNVENLGLDETDRLIFRLSCEVIYKKESNN